MTKFDLSKLTPMTKLSLPFSSDAESLTWLKALGAEVDFTEIPNETGIWTTGSIAANGLKMNRNTFKRLFEEIQTYPGMPSVLSIQVGDERLTVVGSALGANRLYQGSMVSGQPCRFFNPGTVLAISLIACVRDTKFAKSQQLIRKCFGIPADLRQPSQYMEYLKKVMVEGIPANAPTLKELSSKLKSKVPQITTELKDSKLNGNGKGKLSSDFPVIDESEVLEDKQSKAIGIVRFQISEVETDIQIHETALENLKAHRASLEDKLTTLLDYDRILNEVLRAG